MSQKIVACSIPFNCALKDSKTTKYTHFIHTNAISTLQKEKIIHIAAAAAVALRSYSRLMIIKRSKNSRSRSQLVYSLLFISSLFAKRIHVCEFRCCIGLSVCIHTLHFISFHMRRISFLLSFLPFFFLHILSFGFHLQSPDSLLGLF